MLTWPGQPQDLPNVKATCRAVPPAAPASPKAPVAPTAPIAHAAPTAPTAPTALHLIIASLSKPSSSHY